MVTLPAGLRQNTFVELDERSTSFAHILRERLAYGMLVRAQRLLLLHVLLS